MKRINLIFFIILLSCCSFGNGFRPPPSYDNWWLPNANEYILDTKSHGLYRMFLKRDKDMRDCNIDPVAGESSNIHSNLCLERKGWRLESGMVCDDPINTNDSICIKWRAECQAGKMKKDIPCQEWRAKHGY